jgi:hypothetical protein
MNATAFSAAAAATAPPLRHGRSSGFAASVLPDLQRSEAFVEDLFEASSFGAERSAARPAGVWAMVALCGVPLLVALLGGAMAFFHSIG